MEKKIFKYKIVGIILFLVELFILLLFCYGSYDTFIEVNLEKLLSNQNMIFVFASLTAIIAFLSLISLLFKSRKTILILNIHYSIILLFFLIGFIPFFFEGNYTTEDNFKFIIIFSIIFILFVVVNFFRYKNVDFSEIENLGKNN